MRTEQEIKDMRDKFKKEKDDPKWLKSTREMAQHCYGILEWVVTEQTEKGEQ